MAGFALTFSPPKTVSVLWALGDEAVSGAVLGAHEAAVGAAMAFLEDHAAFTWRGRGGLLQVDTEGLLAAAFVHRTSRAADPQLHTHLLLANKVRTQDGRWLSLDARELFAHQKAAGMLYKAALRSELTGRCGVSWSVVDDNGVAEIEGVPDGLCAAWSARRQAVKAAGDELVAKREAELARSLTSSERATCFQLAAYRTRAPKVDAETPTATLKARWHEEAVAFGHDPARWLPGVLGHERPVTAMPPVDQLATVVARLEERSATWTRADVVEECARLVSGSDGPGVLEAVEALAEQVLRDPEVVALAAPPPACLRREDGMAQFERHGGRHFTTTGASTARSAGHPCPDLSRCTSRRAAPESRRVASLASSPAGRTRIALPKRARGVLPPGCRARRRTGLCPSRKHRCRTQELGGVAALAGYPEGVTSESRTPRAEKVRSDPRRPPLLLPRIR